jgi:hypothetical protein
MRRFFRVTAAIVAAVVVLTLATLPPARISLPHVAADGTIAGVIHIHTNRSDGRGSLDEIARAAASAGLGFIVFTDHGDATRPPDPPAYRSGVLCIDGVEISTSGGHYVALGLPQAPYPLGGEPRDVVEDVARLGGFGIAAHPDSPKPELGWRDWNAPIDGVEILNPDSGWRMRVAEPGWRPKLRLIERLFSYPARPAETVASFIAESPDTLARWDAVMALRKVVGLAGADAHSKLALVSSEPGDNRFALALPSYSASFRALSVHARPAGPLSGNAAADAAAILQGVRAGHVYTAVDGIASPPEFLFTAESDAEPPVGEGDEVPAGTPLMLRVRSNAPASFTTTIWEGSRVLSTSHAQEIALPVGGSPAAYRVEIHASDRARDPVWVIGNPIYVRSADEAPAAIAAPPSTSAYVVFGGGNSRDWRVEHDPASAGSVEPATIDGEGALHLKYSLAAAAGPSHAAVALLRDLSDGLHGGTRIRFTAHADHPMRVSVQLRTFAGRPFQERWHRSVYLDAADREHVLTFDDFTPVGDSRTFRPALPEMGYVMFVIDTTNAKPGTSGELWLRRIAIER